MKHITMLAWVAMVWSAEGNAAPLRSGANHHLGDDGLIAMTGRSDVTASTEKQRMHAHLVYARQALAMRRAPTAALQRQRARLLGFLDEYIQRGITPKNHHIGHRTPVFIDDDGNICAVGYLIERSVGRQVAEQIAAQHRFDYLETIAASMPAARDWIAQSGFSIDELASIQPGYVAEIDQIEHWVSPAKPTEAMGGSLEKTRTVGEVVAGHMHGQWSVQRGELRGEGKLRAGAGTWTVFDGSTRFATGPMRRDLPDGQWTFFHASGRVAAQGKFVRGTRSGQWRMFYDDARHTVLAAGRFDHGAPASKWNHFTDDGRLVATTKVDRFGNNALTWREQDGLFKEVIQYGQDADYHEISSISDGSTRLYFLQQPATQDGEVQDPLPIAALIIDEQGNGLTFTDGAWKQSRCQWTPAQRNAARRGTSELFAKLLHTSNERAPRCVGATPVTTARAAIVARLIAARDRKTPVPLVVQRSVHVFNDADDEARDTNVIDDFSSLLAAGMRWWIELPHVDRPFIRLASALPGYVVP